VPNVTGVHPDDLPVAESTHQQAKANVETGATGAVATPQTKPRATTGLAEAIQEAAGPLETPPSAAAQVTDAPVNPGDIPVVPPQGAIQSAIGTRRQTARACLKGQAAASRVTLVFASTGRVQVVSVAGPASGTDAEACLVTTLSKAAVGPFVRDKFTVTTTISPP
jgi:hypothetical protein